MWTPKQPGQEKTRDHVEANRLHVSAKADPEGHAGSYPGRAWEHEKWATDAYRYSGRTMVHKPDAHVRMFGTVFFVERQTRESRVSVTEIDDKVSGHATYARVRMEENHEARVLFAREERWVAEAARRAGERHGSTCSPARWGGGGLPPLPERPEARARPHGRIRRLYDRDSGLSF